MTEPEPETEMGTRTIILLVLFVMTMFLWLLANLAAFGEFKYAGWLPFFASLWLGLLVFLGEPRRTG